LEKLLATYDFLLVVYTMRYNTIDYINVRPKADEQPA